MLCHDAEPSDHDIDYDALIAELTDPARPIHSSGQALTGADAAAAGRSLFTTDELRELLTPAEFDEWERGRVSLAG